MSGLRPPSGLKKPSGLRAPSSGMKAPSSVARGSIKSTKPKAERSAEASKPKPKPKSKKKKKPLPSFDVEAHKRKQQEKRDKAARIKAERKANASQYQAEAGARKAAENAKRAQLGLSTGSGSYAAPPASSATTTAPPASTTHSPPARTQPARAQSTHAAPSQSSSNSSNASARSATTSAAGGVEAWLASIGVTVSSTVRANLETEKIDRDAIEGLSKDDLKELGFAMGERSKIVRAQGGGGAPTPAPSTRATVHLTSADPPGGPSLTASSGGDSALLNRVEGDARSVQHSLDTEKRNTADDMAALDHFEAQLTKHKDWLRSVMEATNSQLAALTA